MYERGIRQFNFATLMFQSKILQTNPDHDVHLMGCMSLSNYRGGRKRLPKFKFSAKFPIGLHVILQIQIKKFEKLF